jgi:hypothetical protein
MEADCSGHFDMSRIRDMKGTKYTKERIALTRRRVKSGTPVADKNDGSEGAYRLSG